MSKFKTNKYTTLFSLSIYLSLIYNLIKERIKSTQENIKFPHNFTKKCSLAYSVTQNL